MSQPNVSPFSDRGRIEDRSRFFGRNAILAAIFNKLASPTPQNVAVIGARRIGRSSLLWHIRQVYCDELPNPGTYRFHYLDLANDTLDNPAGFYGAVAAALFEWQGGRIDGSHFDQLRKQHNPDGAVRHVLLLDEFNVLQRRHAAFDDTFYEGLRSRIQGRDLTLVLASHLELPEIARANDFTSTFFGIFQSVPLGPFSEAEARQAVLREAAPRLQEYHFGRIAAWTNRTWHPLTLNIAADIWWEYLRSGRRELDEPALQADWRKQVDEALGNDASRRRRRDRIVGKGLAGGRAVWHWLSGRSVIFWAVAAVAIALLIGWLNSDQVRELFLHLIGMPTPAPPPVVP